MLKQIQPNDVRAMRRRAFDEQTLIEAAAIVRDVRERGEAAVSEYAARFDGAGPATPLVIDLAQLQAACETISDETRDLLVRTVERIRRFADAQRTCFTDLTINIPGGAAGHTIHPLATAEWIIVLTSLRSDPQAIALRIERKPTDAFSNLGVEAPIDGTWRRCLRTITWRFDHVDHRIATPT